MANDHYVPRFLLKNFQIAEKPGMVYSYKRGKKPLPMSIRKVASADNYYAIKSSTLNIDRNFPDDFLSTVENEAAPILKRLLTADSFDVYLSEHLTLAWFIALLANRTPWARERLINWDKAKWTRRIQKEVANAETFKMIVAGNPELSHWTPEQMERIRGTLLNDFDGSLILSHQGDVEDHFLGRAFNLSETLSSVLLMKNWILLECPTSQVFVTSDNPVILLPPKGYFPGMNVGFVNAPILVPISPKRALLLSDLKGKGIVRVWGQKMDEMVSQTITYGHEAIYSNISSDEFQEIFNSVDQGVTTLAYPGQRKASPKG